LTSTSRGCQHRRRPAGTFWGGAGLLSFYQRAAAEETDFFGKCGTFPRAWVTPFDPQNSTAGATAWRGIIRRESVPVQRRRAVGILVRNPESGGWWGALKRLLGLRKGTPPSPALRVNSRLQGPLMPGQAIPAVFDSATDTLHIGTPAEGHAECATLSGLDPVDSRLAGLSIIAGRDTVRVLNGSMGVTGRVPAKEAPRIRAVIERLTGKTVEWHELPKMPWEERP
jgi:hypothetical protein